MAGEKIYAKGVVKAKSTQYGIKIGLKASEFIEFLNQNTNDKGFVNLELKERRAADDKGNTHYIELDTYTPQEKPF